MSNRAESIRTRLLNIAKERKVEFQDILNRFGAEQFLARLSISGFSEQFIFKGGFLLTYLIETERQTKDLDFSISHVSNTIEGALNIVDSILAIPMEDELVWGKIDGSPLNHPEMDYPGMRIKCPFVLAKAKGSVRLDLAFGDIVDPKKISLARIRYKGQPLIGQDFNILAYPPETIFSEKFQAVIKLAGKNTRMKDYYDLFKLVGLGSLDSVLVRRNIQKTFSKRETLLQRAITFDDEILDQLQVYWARFIRKMGISDAPSKLKDVITFINEKMEKIYGNK